MDKIIDPVHQDNIDKQWYFWDEVWAYKMGPYGSEEEARAELFKYCRYLATGAQKATIEQEEK